MADLNSLEGIREKLQYVQAVIANLMAQKDKPQEFVKEDTQLLAEIKGFEALSAKLAARGDSTAQQSVPRIKQSFAYMLVGDAEKLARMCVLDVSRDAFFKEQIEKLRELLIAVDDDGVGTSKEIEAFDKVVASMESEVIAEKVEDKELSDVMRRRGMY